MSISLPEPYKQNSLIQKRGTFFREYNQQHVERFVNGVRFIVQDLGIRKELTKDSTMRFFDYLRKYYSEFTFDDVKTAFELLLVGELDAYLPKGRDGEADKNHYQEFSAEFYTRVLNAYRSKKKQVQAVIIKALPPPPITELDKEENRNALDSDIIRKFEKYKDGVSVRFAIEFVVVNRLIEAGLIDEHKAPTEEDKKAALTKLHIDRMNGAVNKWDFIHESKEDSPRLQIMAKNITLQKQITDVFDKIIAENKHISEWL